MAHRDGQAVRVCWVIKGYALNTVPFLLVTCRQLPAVCVCGGLTRIYGCPPPHTHTPGGVWQSEEKFGLIGELPHRSMSDQSAACVPFSTPRFRGVFWNILLSHIKHLIFSVLK